MVSDKKEELRKASNAKKKKELQFLKSQMEKDLKVSKWPIKVTQLGYTAVPKF